MLELITGKETAYLAFTFHLIALALVLTFIICLIDFCRRPWHIVRRFVRTLHRWQIKNRLGEYPTIKRIRKSPQKAHELVIEVDSKGLGLDDFDKELEHFKVGLNSAVRMEYGEQDTIILLYVLPRKYVKPTIISPKDNAIGPISLQHLINLLVIGATGTGKTVTIKMILYKLAKCGSNPKIWLLDFKQFDFRSYADLPHYYGFTDCLQGLNDYYTAFKSQQALRVAGTLNYLIIDEWGSFVKSLEKKDAEQAKRLLAELLMVGRAYNFIPIVGIQRPDASYFDGGRDNFQACLALGNLSPEGRRMVFPDIAKEQITDCKKREGHLYIDSVGFEKIRIEDIADIGALDMSIREAISR